MTSVLPSPSSPLDFLASLANEQRKTLVTKKNITNADLAVSPSLYMKALFMKTCSRMQLPIRSIKSEYVTPTATYDMEVSRAVRTCNLEQMRTLFAEGKSFDACNRFGETLLHMACRRGNIKVVKFLIFEAKVQVDVRDDFGRTVLHDACWTSRPHSEVLDVLMEVVAPEFWVTEDKRGHTPFDYVRRDHWKHWLKYLRKNQSRIVHKFTSL